MAKKEVFIKKIGGLEAHRQKILLGLILLLTLFSMSFVSAWEFDNSKDYDETLQKVTIKNSFGLGRTIAEARLLTPKSIVVNLDSCEGGKGIDCLVGEIEFNSYEDYTDVFNEMESFNIKDKMKKVSKSYTFKQKIKTGERTINDYENVCNEFYTNGSVKCHPVLIGNHKENVYNYIPIDKSQGLKTGIITLGVFTNVNEGEHTEVIPTLFGVRISEWWDFGSAIVYSAWETNDAAGFGIDSPFVRGSVFWTNKSHYNITGAEVYIKSDAGVSNCNLSIWSHAINNLPQTLLTSNNSFRGNISTDYKWVNVSLSPVTLNNNTNYSITIQCIGGASFWMSKWTGAGISGRGTRSADNASTWVGPVDEPGMYRIWGVESNVSSPVYELNVNLTMPADNTHTSVNTQVFNSTIYPTNLNITNATLYVWYINHSNYISNTQNITTLSNETTIVNWTLSSIPYNDFVWNVLACGNNSICYDAPSNYSFTINAFTENSQSYNATTTETLSESFMINITYNTSIYTLGIGVLRYNGTDYLGSATTSGPDTLFRRSISVPSVTSQQNVTFKWMFTFTGANGTFYDNSTEKYQNISVINASVYDFPYNVPFINFTIYNESSLARVNATFKATFNYGLSSLFKNLSYEDATVKNSSFSFSFNPYDKNYLVSGTIEYSAPGFAPRTYNLNEQTLTNSTTMINLYLLNTGDSTSFIISVRDNTYTQVGGAVVHIQKYNSGTGTWTTIEVVTTNDDGKALGHFETEDYYYRFLVYVNGVLQLTSSQTKIICEASPCTITLTLPSSSQFVTFDNITSLEKTLTYTKSTTLFTYSYIDTSANAQGGRLEVKRISLGNSTDLLVCNTTSAAVSGVLTCSIASSTNGTFVARGFITRGGNEIEVARIIINKISDIINTIGLDGIIWSVFLLIGIVMIGLYRPVLAVLFSVVGLIMISLLGLAFIPTTAIVIIIFMALMFMWEMKR